jgi:hypothetical protein
MFDCADTIDNDNDSNKGQGLAACLPASPRCHLMSRIIYASLKGSCFGVVPMNIRSLSRVMSVQARSRMQLWRNRKMLSSSRLLERQLRQGIVYILPY